LRVFGSKSDEHCFSPTAKNSAGIIFQFGIFIRLGVEHAADFFAFRRFSGSKANIAPSGALCGVEKPDQPGLDQREWYREHRQRSARTTQCGLSVQPQLIPSPIRRRSWSCRSRAQPSQASRSSRHRSATVTVAPLISSHHRQECQPGSLRANYAATWSITFAGRVTGAVSSSSKAATTAPRASGKPARARSMVA